MYKVYLKSENYAKFHNTTIKHGSVSLSAKSEKILSESEFDLQYNKHKFVICELSDGFHIAFVKIGADSETMLKISNNNLMIVYDDEKIKNNNIPNMSKQSFFTELKHVSAPDSITKIDFSELSKILFLEKNKLPKLLHNSPEAAWYRLNIGDVIKIVYNSVIGGKNVEYREVVSA
jgi:DNA-directed RNA polymerase subunit H (RpoH/RPB5)